MYNNVVLMENAEWESRDVEERPLLFHLHLFKVSSSEMPSCTREFVPRRWFSEPRGGGYDTRQVYCVFSAGRDESFSFDTKLGISNIVLETIREGKFLTNFLR